MSTGIYTIIIYNCLWIDYSIAYLFMISFTFFTKSSSIIGFLIKGIVEEEENLQLQEIERRSALYGKKEGFRQPLKNKINDKTATTIVLIDDGAASGATVIAAARSIRRTFNLPNNKLIIALPVAPKETVQLLRREADHVEVVTAPSSFFRSVGQYYQSFEPISDEKVIEIMKSKKDMEKE